METEALLSQIFEELPLPVTVFKGDELRIHELNQESLNLFGKDRSIIGSRLTDIFPELESQQLFQLLQDCYASGASANAGAETVFLLKGSTRETYYFNIKLKPLRRKNGEVWGVMQTLTDVTDLVEFRKSLTNDDLQLANEQQKLITLVEHSDDLIGITDLQGNVTYLNKAGQLLVGASGLKECLRPASDYLFEEEQEKLRPFILDSMQRTGRWSGEVHYRNFKTGEAIPCHLNAFYIKDPITGEMLGMASVTRDLRAEKAARKEQQKLLTLVENSGDLMSILEPNGVNSYINKAGREMLGFETEEQVRTTPIAELHSPEDLEFVQKEVFPVLQERGRWEGKMMVKHLKTGEVFPVFNKSITINDPITGELVALGGLMRDMRAELAAQQAVADSEKLLRDITTAAPAGLWMTDENMQVTYLNQVWLDWTGTSLEQQKKQRLEAILPDEDRQAAEALFNADFTGRRFHQSQFKITNEKGQTRWVIRTGNPQYASDGTFTGYIGACVDITELKQLQQQKDEFLGIASHELKTPVTSIKAYAQVLESMFRDSGDIKKADLVKRMDTQVDRLTNLIGDLLDVTKIQTGKLQFNDREFDFNEMVTELVEDLQRTTKKHTIVKELQAAGTVFADRERIAQVISNLITNAIKYSPNANKIMVYTRLEKNEVRLCVQDFGIGIPDDKKDRVFEQFYRVSGDEQHTFPGLGLGLYISSEIVKREGGKIWVNSTEGRGSTFCFSLPVNINE